MNRFHHYYNQVVNLVKAMGHYKNLAYTAVDTDVYNTCFDEGLSHHLYQQEFRRCTFMHAYTS